MRFRGAKITGDYVTLSGLAAMETGRNLPYPCSRGIDVRADDIIWIVDAAEGS